MFTSKGCFFIFLAGASWCQDEGGLTARAMYYRERPDNDQLPPRAQVTASSKAPVGKPASKSQTNSTGSVRTQTSQTGGASATDGTNNTAVSKPFETKQVVLTPPRPVDHLGLRYNVMLVNTKTQKSQAVESDRTFQAGECI